AGREAPGAVYRCWAEAEDARLPRFPAPEIKVADLAAFALQAACWGDPDASGLALLDPPPSGAMAAAREVLSAVGAVDPAGRATERGVRMSGLGLHPRLARALLDATPLVGADLAAEVVALLSEEPPRECGDDLTAVLRSVRRGGDAYAGRWRTEVRRLRAASTPAPAPRPLSTDAVGGGGARADRRGSGRDKAQAPVGGDRSPSPVDASNSSVVGSNPPADDFGSSSRPARRDSGAGRWSGAGEERAVGLVVASAFPERVAKADGGAYLMASGTRARIGDG
ncbi:ATP-dependent helicase, partial [Streptomyces ipomoeae]|nr:ATP-dependent helicase [Streptomyces ipomoeae]MDX2881346.1 ATP-dependent helicase [Streptomyces ipomoeae]